jgi:hypothetical protein
MSGFAAPLRTKTPTPTFARLTRAERGSNLMSPYSINDPKHWLDRAKEARALAEQIGDPEAKRTMLKNPMITSGSLKEPKNEPQGACHSQSSYSIRGSCARVGLNGHTNKCGARRARRHASKNAATIPL